MSEKTKIPTYVVPDEVIGHNNRPIILTKKQKRFLHLAAQSGDEQAAAKEAGYKSVSEALESEYVSLELAKIQRAWAYEVRMDAKFASGEHMRLMEKFEKDYDSLTSEDRSKMAAVLAKMSDTSLKASGKMSDLSAGNSERVMVQINVGSEPQEKDVTPSE